MTTVTTLPEHHKLLTSAIFSSVSLPVPPLETLSETVFAARASVLCTCTQRVRAGGSTGSLAIKWWREHPPPVSKVVALLDVDSVVENPKVPQQRSQRSCPGNLNWKENPPWKPSIDRSWTSTYRNGQKNMLQKKCILHFHHSQLSIFAWTQPQLSMDSIPPIFGNRGTRTWHRRAQFLRFESVVLVATSG